MPKPRRRRRGSGEAGFTLETGIQTRSEVDFTLETGIQTPTVPNDIPSHGGRREGAGRPPMGSVAVRERLNLRVSKLDLRAFEEAARRHNERRAIEVLAGLKVSVWAREVLRHVARAEVDMPVRPPSDDGLDALFEESSR